MQYFIKPGDHISYSCRSYSHHGIYCGDISYKNRDYKDVVIHFEGKQKKGQIRGISYNKFAQEHEIFIMQYEEKYCLSTEAVIRRAISKLSEQDYNLFVNNCEHFAHWCKTGKYSSDQVNNAVGILGRGVGLGGVVAVIVLPLAIPGVVVMGVGAAASAACGHLGGLATEFIMGSPYYKRE